jgi:citrate lyase synthetase
MPYQNINVTISPTDVQAVKDSLTAILEKLPFLVNLTAKERKGLVKTGPDSLSFVQNASSAAQNNATIFPASFNKTDFQKDVDLLATLTEIGTLASSIASRIDDTRLAVGSEAMQQATQVYNYVKTAAKNTPGLKPLAEQLGERFQKSSKPKEPKPPSA